MTVVDKSTQKIQIPIRYIEEMESIPKKHPKSWDNILKQTDFSPKGIIKEAQIEDNYLTFLIQYNKPECGSAIFGFILYSPLFIPWTIIEPKQAKEYFKENCYVFPINLKTITIENPWDIKSLEELGLLATFEITPKTLAPVCQKKLCVVMDENGEIVNEIVIHKTLKVNHNKMNSMLRTEEKERKEWEKKQKIFEEEQKRECPSLYQTLLTLQNNARYYGVTNPQLAIKASQRFEVLNCGWYINNRMNNMYL